MTNFYIGIYYIFSGFEMFLECLVFILLSSIWLKWVIAKHRNCLFFFPPQIKKSSQFPCVIYPIPYSLSNCLPQANEYLFQPWVLYPVELMCQECLRPSGQGCLLQSTFHSEVYIWATQVSSEYFMWESYTAKTLVDILWCLFVPEIMHRRVPEVFLHQ
jgi:hypothetical protein